MIMSLIMRMVTVITSEYYNDDDDDDDDDDCQTERSPILISASIARSTLLSWQPEA